MADLSYTLKYMIDGAQERKKMAQRMGAFLKSGKARYYLDLVDAMAQGDITYYAFAGEQTMYINVYVKELEGFKNEPRLEGILQQFNYMNPTDCETSDLPSQLRRDFGFAYDHIVDEDQNRIRVKITIECTVKSDSATCKQVVIGMTEGKPMPIYKLECSDGEYPPVLDEIQALQDAATE